VRCGRRLPTRRTREVAVAIGWIGRAERLLEPFDLGPQHGWLSVARVYRTTVPDVAEQAMPVARAAGNSDLEVVGLSQLGLVRAGKGDTGAGFALIDDIGCLHSTSSFLDYIDGS